MITLIYFASIREQLGVGQESVELPLSVHTVAELSAWLQQERGDQWAKALGSVSTLTAVNQEMVGADFNIKTGDEVAFFPPVTGG